MKSLQLSKESMSMKYSNNRLFQTVVPTTFYDESEKTFEFSIIVQKVYTWRVIKLDHDLYLLCIVHPVEQSAAELKANRPCDPSGTMKWGIRYSFNGHVPTNLRTDEEKMGLPLKINHRTVRTYCRTLIASSVKNPVHLLSFCY